jgi:hypothetical protein
MIDLNEKSPKSVVVLRSTKIIKAISGFTIAGNNMFLTSWGDVTFMTC